MPEPRLTSRRPENDYDAGRHVFAAVLADAFHYRQRAAIPYGEAFAGAARDVKFATRRAIQHGVSRQHVAAPRCFRPRGNRNRPAAQSLAYVIIRFADEAGTAGPKSGMRRSSGPRCRGIRSRSFRRRAPRNSLRRRNLAAQMSADGAVRIRDREFRRRATGSPAACRNAANQFAVNSDGVLRSLRPIPRCAPALPSANGRESGPLRHSRGRNFSTAPTISLSERMPSAARRSRTSLGNAAEIRHHHFRTADEASAHRFILRGNSRRAGIQDGIAAPSRSQSRAAHAVPKPNSSAPSSAATITSRPNLNPPSTRRRTRLRKPVRHERVVRIAQVPFPRADRCS